jgi:hypothetical protein
MNDQHPFSGITNILQLFKARITRLPATVPRVRAGQAITTSGTRLSWRNLAEWVAAWRQLQRRRHSSRRYAQESAHKCALPLEMIPHEADPAVLYEFLDIMHSSNVRPPLRLRSVQAKGMRHGHPTTQHVVAANNRLSQLGAASYRCHRRQAGLHRAMQQTELPGGRRPPRNEAADHLSPF